MLPASSPESAGEVPAAEVSTADLVAAVAPESEESPARGSYAHVLRHYQGVYKHDERTVKRWIKRGRDAAPSDLPPLDDAARMPPWWALHYPRRKCPQSILDAALCAAGAIVVPEEAVEQAPELPIAAAAQPEEKAEQLDLPPALSGYRSMLDRVRRAESETGAELERLQAVKGDDRDEAKIAQARRAWKENVDQLRELERDANKILESQGESISKADLRRELAGLHAPIVNGMRSIFRRIYQRLQTTDGLPAADRIYQAEVDRVCSQLLETDFVTADE